MIHDACTLSNSHTNQNLVEPCTRSHFGLRTCTLAPWAVLHVDVGNRTTIDGGALWCAGNVYPRDVVPMCGPRVATQLDENPDSEQ